MYPLSLGPAALTDLWFDVQPKPGKWALLMQGLPAVCPEN
jgi:hypothetical protein